MRVALIDPSLYTPPYDSALIGGLQQRGNEVRLFGREPRSTDVPLGAHVNLSPVFYTRTEAWRRGMGQRWLPFAKALEHTLGFGKLERALQAFDPQIVHWQWPSVPIIDRAFLRRLSRRWPQVVTVHDTNLFHRTGIARVRTLGWTSFISSAQQVIVHLESSRNVLRQRGVLQDRINVVRHGVFDRSNVTHLPRSGSDRLRVLFFGRITRNKGIHTLLDATAMLPAELRARLELHVTGAMHVPPDQWSALLARTDLGETLRLRAEFIPEEELDAMIATADIVVCPHLDVDASGALMKAAAYDTAIITSDIPSFLETLGSTGAAAQFRAGDPASLAAVLQRLLSQDGARHELQEKIRALRAGALSWPALADQTVDVYRKAQLRGQN